MSDTTVVIKTIGRDTLRDAVASAKREGFRTLVIADGVDVEDVGADRAIRLGRRFGYYGGMCANVGAALVETEFITFLDDDDEFVIGAGDVIRKKLKENPEIDIWIGGLRFDRVITLSNPVTREVFLSSKDVCLDPSLGIRVGNVGMPTYRTTVFSKVPYADTVPSEQATITDFFHVQSSQSMGYKVDWVGEVLYLVRPKVLGANGGGA